MRAIAAVAFFNISEVMDWNGNSLTVKPFEEIPKEARACIKSIEVNESNTAHGSERKIKVQFYDRVKALDLLMKHTGAYEQDNNLKQDLTQNNKFDLSGLSFEELLELKKI